MRRLVFFLIGAAVATGVSAQSASMKPFDLNLDRVKVSTFGGNFGETTTYLVPGVTIRVSVLGSVWAQNKGAKAHAKYFVDGLQKEMLQSLAKTAQDDLVTKLKAQGYTVLTYDDVKAEPDVASRPLLKPDPRFDLPSGGGLGAPVTFVYASPSDAQAWDNPIQGPTWPLRGLAKAKNLTVIVPELTFTTPQMFGKVESGVMTDKAGVGMDPRMIFEGAAVYGLTPKGGGPAITVLQHGKRTAADVAGTISLASSDNMHVNHVLDFTSGNYVMVLDQTAFTDGILRVAFAVNSMIANEVKKEHR